MQPLPPPPLECPLCTLPLMGRDRTLACPAGHSFDVARQGYVNLLPPQHRTRGVDGDTREMLQARRRFLEAGHFAPLRDALESEVEAVLERRAPNNPPAVIETGCGEGYYIGGMAERLSDSHNAVVLGTDLSKAAVRAAAARYDRALFFVADVHRRIYVQDASIAVLLDVFAPRDPYEFARVLEPGGSALIVIPAPEHLAGVRAEFGLLDVQPDKERLLLERFAESFTLAGRREIRYPLELKPEAARDLIAMGPNAWHGSAQDAIVDAVVTEAAFVVLRLDRIG